MKLANSIKHCYTAFQNHIWADVRDFNFKKPWHFIVANIKYRFFGYPYVVLIETGTYCNLHCPTCPTPADKIGRQKELMSFSNFKRIIGHIKNAIHVVMLYFTNEPLLNPDIFSMIRYAYQNNLYTEISTNAVLLTEEKTKAVFKSGLDKIIIDLDGTTKESYEAFRAGADFDKVLNNITYFCSQKQVLKLKKPFIELQFVLNKLNQNEVEDIKILARKLKVDRLSIRAFGLGRYAYSEIERKVLADKFLPDDLRYKQKIRYQKTGGEIVIKNSPTICPLAKSHLVILADGRVAMCCYDLRGEYIYGNVSKNTLKDIWFDPENSKKRKLAENKRYPLCKNCSIYE